MEHNACKQQVKVDSLIVLNNKRCEPTQRKDVFQQAAEKRVMQRLSRRSYLQTSGNIGRRNNLHQQGLQLRVLNALNEGEQLRPHFLGLARRTREEIRQINFAIFELL